MIRVLRLLRNIICPEMCPIVTLSSVEEQVEYQNRKPHFLEVMVQRSKTQVLVCHIIN
jgi:hypothetical protein